MTKRQLDMEWACRDRHRDRDGSAGAGDLHGDQRLHPRLRSLRGEAEARSSRVTEAELSTGPSSSRATASSPQRLEQWCERQSRPTHHGDDVDAECRTLVRELGAAGFLNLCVADGDAPPDVRSLAIARETLARHSGLADFAFAMQGLGSGAISLAGIARAEGRMAAQGRQRRGHRRLRHDRTRHRQRRRQHRHDRARATATAGVLDGEKTYISNGGIADFYTVFARTGEGDGARGLSRVHRPRRRPRPQRRRADRGDRAPPARPAQVRRRPRRTDRRAGRRLRASPCRR